MGDYNSVRTHHDYMSFSIYNFLDNLLAAVRPSDTVESESNNRDQIITQVKPGGYSEEIFIFLSDREKEEYNCSVCYSVVKDVHQCRNGHKFCYSCIYVWSTCNRAGADCCPACRCDGVYARNYQLNEKIGRKRVKCVSAGCNWRGFLRDYNDHEHRTYDFRELNTSIELPFIKRKESSNVINSPGSTKIESSEITKSDDENTFSGDLNHNSNTNNARDKVDEQTNTANAGGTNTVRVSRTSLAPRRLIRNTENNVTNSRASILRPSLNNYSRSTTLATRCPAYRHSVSNTRLSRLPRNTVNGNLSNHDNSPSVSTESAASRQTAQNEYTQTNILESPSFASESTNPNNRESSTTENSDSSLRSASAAPNRSLQLPAINPNNLSHVSSDRTPMEYRRLAPTYASRRGNFGVTPNEGREQLAMMLILLTSDLEDRVTLTDQSRNMSNAHDQMGSENNVSIIENTSSNSSRTSVRLGRSRLQEFRNLNRRLSEVANSLDRLIASTSREDDRHHTTFNGSPESLTSDTTSDVDEEFNNNSFYR